MFSKLINKSNANFVFAIFVIWCSTNTAHAQTAYWSVIGDENKETFLGFGLNVDRQLKSESLVFEGENVKYNKRLDSINYTRVLIEYYDLARKNEISSIRKLYYSKDGSLQRFDNDVVDMPDMLFGYRNIKKIEFGDVYYWGEYIAVLEKWYGDEGLITKWVEFLHCDDVCLLSDRLFHLDKNSSFFSSLLSFVGRDPGTESEKSKFESWDQILFDGKLEKNPVFVRHKFAFLVDQRDFVKTASVEGKDEGVVSKIINFIKDISSSEVSDTPENVNRAIAETSNFVSNVWDEDKLTQFTKDLDREKYVRISKNINIIFGKYWDEDYSVKLIQNYSFASEKIDEKKEKLVLLENYQGVKNFSSFALVQRILSWQTVTPFAYMMNGKYIYLWYEAYDQNNLGGIYIFAFDTSLNKLVSPDSSRVWRLISNNLFSESTVNYLVKKRTKAK